MAPRRIIAPGHVPRNSERRADAEVHSPAFVAYSVIQAQRADRSHDPDSKSNPDMRLEPTLPKTVELHTGIRTTPGIADVHEDDALELWRERLAELRGRQEQVLSPKAVIAIATKIVAATHEELLEERQRADRSAYNTPQREHRLILGGVVLWSAP